MVPSPTRNSFICGEYDLRMKTRQVTSKLWYEYSRRQSNQLRGEDIVSGQKTEKGKLAVRTYMWKKHAELQSRSQQPAAAERKRNATTSSSSSSALSFSLVRPPTRGRPAPDRLGSRLPAPHQTSKAWKRKDRWETEDGTGGENVMMPGLTRLDARARVRGLRPLLSRYASRPPAGGGAAVCLRLGAGPPPAPPPPPPPPLALAPTSDWADSSSLSLSELLPPPQPAASASACVRAGHHHARHATPRPAVLAASSVSPIHPQSPRLPNPCSVVSTGKKFLSCVPFTRART
jgi:hypothetical protein